MRKRTRSKKNRYWTTIQEYAISAYLRVPEEQQLKRNRIYNRFLAGPMSEMARQIIGKDGGFKYQSGTWEDQEELLSLTLTHMISQMDRIDFERGKAFSFYSHIVYNFIIYKCKKENKRGSIFTNVEDVQLNHTPDWKEDFDFSSEELSFDDSFVEEENDSPLDFYIDKIDHMFQVSCSVLSAMESGVLSSLKTILSNVYFGFDYQRDAVSFIQNQVEGSTSGDVKSIIERVYSCRIA